MLLSLDSCRFLDRLKNKNKPSPTNARPATPPTTPPTIAPTGVFPEDLLSVESVGVVLGVEVPDLSVGDVVADCVVFENVEEVDGFAGSTEDTSLQTSLLPGPPSTHLFVQNLTTAMSPFCPPTQWNSVLVDTPLLLASRDAF